MVIRLLQSLLLSPILYLFYNIYLNKTSISPSNEIVALDNINYVVILVVKKLVDVKFETLLEAYSKAIDIVDT